MASFSKETLEELAYLTPGSCYEDILLVEKTLHETTRWGHRWRIIFQPHGEGFYEFIFEVGSGDSDYSDWDNWDDDDAIEVQSVVPVERTIIDYVHP
jgi:hypothetical protein